MSGPNLPPRGDTDQVARVCLRWAGREWGPDANNTCGKPASVHVFWDFDGDNAFACEEHAEEIRERWQPYQIHKLSPCCGMPGALWFRSERTCRYEEGGLPVAERREESVEVGGRA